LDWIAISAPIRRSSTAARLPPRGATIVGDLIGKFDVPVLEKNGPDETGPKSGRNRPKKGKGTLPSSARRHITDRASDRHDVAGAVAERPNHPSWRSVERPSRGVFQLA
jgi:hypothetical protein